MQILREIIESPWFYGPFGIIAVLVLLSALRQGIAPGEALAPALVNAFFLAFAISGIHRIYKRLHGRGP